MTSEEVAEAQKLHRNERSTWRHAAHCGGLWRDAPVGVILQSLPVNLAAVANVKQHD